MYKHCQKDMSNLFKINFLLFLWRQYYHLKVNMGNEKKEKNVTPALTREVFRTAKAYSDIAKRCSLCLDEKLAIISHPCPNGLLNRRSELITKCRHENKFLLKNFNSND